MTKLFFHHDSATSHAHRANSALSTLLILTLGLAPCLTGCGPAVSQEELGQIIYDPEKLPGAGGPYVLPSPPEPEPKPAAAGPEAAPNEEK